MKPCLPLIVSLLAGCSVADSYCPEAKAPKPFAEVGELPTQMRICKSEQRVDFPAADSKKGRQGLEGFLPNVAEVGWSTETPHDAFMASIKHFESTGWEQVRQNPDLLGVVFSKGDYVFEIQSISQQGKSLPVVGGGWIRSDVRVDKAPCVGPRNLDSSQCKAGTCTRCINGWPVGTIDEK